MGHQGQVVSDVGVEVDLYDDDDGSITVIHETEKSRDDILAASSAHGLQEMHNLNLSVIKKPAKEVTFSNIKVRTYPICVGDNPACSDGVPLAIDWQYLKEYNFTVDYYERKLENWANNPDSPMRPNRYPRKTENDLRISAVDRMQLLFSSGVMPQEATLAFRQVELIRRDRQASIRSLHFLQLMYAWERVQRATRNATVGRKSKRKERLMLQPYRDGTPVDDSVEISVDEVSTPARRWFAFRNSTTNNSKSNAGILHHKRKKPAPMQLNQSYETVSVATNTPQSVVSYNGETLFPPTPTTSPLSKTIQQRNMISFEPRVIDMTGQVSGKIGASAPMTRSTTMKRANKPKDRFFDDDDDLLGEGIMDRSMDTYGLDRSVDRYAATQQVSPVMEEDVQDRLDTSMYSSSSSGIFNFRRLDWIGSTNSVASVHSRQQQPTTTIADGNGSNHSRQQPMSSGSVHSRTHAAIPTGSGHSSNHSRRNNNDNAAPSGAMSVASSGSNAASAISNNIRQFVEYATGTNMEENADRGYFLNSDERYY